MSITNLDTNTKSAIIIFVVLFFIIGIGIAIYFVLKYTQDKSPNTNENKLTYTLETQYDSSIPSAAEHLLYFRGVAPTHDSVPRWCTPTFYAYRLVDKNDGRFGDLSPWSAYPAIAASEVFTASKELNNDSNKSCNVSGIYIGIPIDIDYSTYKNWSWNVHRQSGGAAADPDSEGEIIGSLYWSNGSQYSIQDDGSKLVFNLWYVDVKNPNKGNVICTDNGCGVANS